MAQLKHHMFHVRNLIPIWVDPNDMSLMIDSDIKANESPAIHFFTRFIYNVKAIVGVEFTT